MPCTTIKRVSYAGPIVKGAGLASDVKDIVKNLALERSVKIIDS